MIKIVHLLIPYLKKKHKNQAIKYLRIYKISYNIFRKNVKINFKFQTSLIENDSMAILVLFLLEAMLLSSQLVVKEFPKVFSSNSHFIMQHVHAVILTFLDKKSLFPVVS